MGGLFAYLAAEATTAIKRKATVYGLMAVGGLLLIFAGGYLLNAGYMMLAFRLGPTTASLIIAGGLLAMAVLSVVAATVLAKQPVFSAKSADKASPFSHAPYRAPYSRKRMVAVGAGAAGAVTAAALLARFKSIRNLLRRRRSFRSSVPDRKV
jgi:hypothetical protein